MLLELAIGDSYGSGFEFCNANLKHNLAAYYVKHARHPHYPGCYTDDTQMSLAISELLLSNKEFTPLNIASMFVSVFQRDPRTGYAHRFYDFIKDISSGKEFLEKISPDSEKSGAAMRSPPIGLLSDLEEVLAKTELQAKVTHNTPNGILAAKAAALITHYFCYVCDINFNKSQLGNWLTSIIGGEWHTPYSKSKIGTSGIDCVHAAVTAIIRSDTLSQVLINSVEFTGDVDTVAAIAMAGASLCLEIENDLSEALYFCLEDTPYGRDYIHELDAELVGKLTKGKRTLRPNPLPPLHLNFNCNLC
ncbi:ADP-ribosylglycohydrolase family protein [Candidatus Parcubacteria bacterium]|nr:MAG: ADP-ribosylglycohydrolase family protein [Candidatus Parcubacteria bacterium]